MCELHIHNGVSLSEPLLNAVHLLGHPYVCMYVFSEVMSQPCPPPPPGPATLILFMYNGSYKFIN